MRKGPLRHLANQVEFSPSLSNTIVTLLPFPLINNQCFAVLLFKLTNYLSHLRNLTNLLQRLQTLASRIHADSLDTIARLNYLRGYSD